MKLEKIAFELIKDLNNKFPRYNAKRISDFNKLVKHFKSKMPKVSNIKLGQIALDYHNYREKGDMGVKIPTIKKMAHTMKKIGMKESFGGILRNLAKHAAKKRMHQGIKARQKAAAKRKRDRGGRFENKMSDKDQYDYLVYMRKYKPDIWRDLQGNSKVKKIMKKFESVNEDVYIGYYKDKKVKVNAKSDKDAKKQIISKLNIPKGDLDRASMINHTKNKWKHSPVAEKKGDFLSSLFPKSKVSKAIQIAKKMSGNMTGAVKAIEKFFPGMSKHNDVRDALRKYNESLNLEELVGKPITEAQFDEAAGKKDACYHKVKARYDVWPSAYASGALVKCRKVGAKNWGNKSKKENVYYESFTENGMTTNHIYYEIDGKGYGYTLEFVNELNEAEYQGRKVKLGKIMQGDQKKFKVYVKNPKGNVVKVNFGQGGGAKGGTMRIRKSNPKARKAFRARHNCDNPGPRHKARYWSCRKW
jgi:hypothetical protein